MLGQVLTWSILLVVSCKPTPAATAPAVDAGDPTADTSALDVEDPEISVDIADSQTTDVADTNSSVGDGTVNDGGCAGSDSSLCADQTSADMFDIVQSDATSVEVDAEPEDIYYGATGKAPIPDILPWPPQCDSPKSKSQNVNGEASCWDPPNGSCAGSESASVTPACSSEGEYCCVFSTSCIPCGWIDCFGCPNNFDCPSVCMAQKWPYIDEKNASVWYSDECLLFQKIVNQCSTCGADIYCPWVK